MLHTRRSSAGTSEPTPVTRHLPPITQKYNNGHSQGPQCITDYPECIRDDFNEMLCREGKILLFCVFELLNLIVEQMELAKYDETVQKAKIKNATINSMLSPF